MSSTVVVAGKLIVLETAPSTCCCAAAPAARRGAARRGSFAGHPTFDADFIALSQTRLLALTVGDGRLHGLESTLRTLVGCRLFRCRDYDRVRVRKNGRLVVGGEPPHHIRWRAGVFGCAWHVAGRSMGIRRSTSIRIPCAASSPVSSS